MSNPKQLLLRNIFSNWFALIVTVAILFFMTPFMVHKLGKEAYGVWALVFSIISYADFLDLGMRQSLARYLPKYHAVGDYDSLNRVINSSSVLYVGFGLVALIGSVVVALSFLGLFNVSSDMLPAMRWTLIVVGISTAIKFFVMPSTAIGPFHRYDIRNGIRIIYQIAGTAVQVYFLLLGYSIVSLAVINLGSTILSSATRRFAQQKLVPQIRFGRRYFNRDIVRKMLDYGSYSLLITIMNLVILSADNVIIGLTLSATHITYYAVALTILASLRNLMSAIGVPLVPAISHFEATDDLKVVAGMSERILKYLFYLCAAVCCGILIFGADFVELWMGPGFEETVQILYILVIPAIVFLPQVASNSVLFGLGRHRLLFGIVATEAVSNIVLSIILVYQMGIIGVALGTAIPQLIIYIIVYPIAYHRVLGVKVSGFYAYGLKSIVLGLAFAGSIGLLSEWYFQTDNWLGFSVAVAVTSISIILGFAWCLLNKEDYGRIFSSFRKNG